MRSRFPAKAAVAGAFALAAMTLAARAEPHGHGGPPGPMPQHPFNAPSGAYRHVPPPPYLEHRWHEGHWYHGDHGHRGGWWWVVGPGWFWYPGPIYPYPDVYVPSEVIVESPPPGPPPAQYWYWCDQPAGYYPYVTQCAVQWRAVTATPPPAPPPPG